MLTTSFNQYSGGTESLGSGSVYLYGYTIAINPNKTVARLQIGNNNAVDILAINLVPHPEQVNLGYGNSSGVALPYDDIGISSTYGWGDGGIDSAGDSYSATPRRPASVKASRGTRRRLPSGRAGRTTLSRPTDNRSRSPRAVTPASSFSRLDFRLRGDRALLRLLHEWDLRYLYPGLQRLEDRIPWTAPETTAPGESIVETASTYDKLDSGRPRARSISTATYFRSIQL